MTASAADRNTKSFDQGLLSYPVAAATQIYLGCAVAVDAAGNAVNLTDSAAVKFVGIASEGVINTTAEGYGTAGDLNVKVFTRGIYAMVAAGLALTDQYADLYWADNQTVQKAPTNLYAGKLARYTSATEALVDIEPALGMSPAADDADYLEVPVSAGADISIGDLVARAADGYAIEAGDATAVEFIGVAVEAADNTLGADGDINVFIQRSGLVTLTAVATMAITDNDRPIFVATDTTVTKVPTDSGLFVGPMVKFVSATSIVVDLKPGLLSRCGDVVSVGVAASKTVTTGSMVCLDADGFLVDADDATAVSFWGICLYGLANAGADGAVDAWVARSGLVQLTGAGLAAADAGKEVWQVTNDVTVTTTPGRILVGHLNEINGATAARVQIKPMPIVGQRADRQFVIPFSHSGAALNSKSARTDMEFPRRYIPLIMQFNVETAPGGSDTLTVTLTDGTTTFAAVVTAAAVLGENKTAMVPATETMKANFDTDITLVDTAALTADLKGHVLCEAL